MKSAEIEGDSEIGTGFELFDDNNPNHSDPLTCPPYHEYDDWDGLISQWELNED